MSTETAAKTKAYGSLRVSEERKAALEKAAIEISYKTGRLIKWSDVAWHLIDKELPVAVKKMIKE